MVRAIVLLLIYLALAQSSNNLVYQVFVRSFADTPADTDRIGDLRGLRENLKYVSDLNAGILWLMPVFPSTTYHGYDIADYRNINPDYGNLRDMDDLIEAAHRRGIRIILDIAFNHTSTEHPWFQEALRDPASPYRKFYHFDPKARNGYLALFSRNMPDLNLAVPEVRAEVKDIAKFWLNRGIDGFRNSTQPNRFWRHVRQPFLKTMSERTMSGGGSLALMYTASILARSWSVRDEASPKSWRVTRLA